MTFRPARIFAFAMFATAWTGPVPAFAGQLTIAVTGVQNENGVIRCGLFSSASGFRVPGKEILELIGKIKKGASTCSFKSVAEGTYAVAVFHAETGEREITYGLFGKPKQGVGFSRNPSITFGPPDFNAAAFSVGPTPANFTIHLKY